MSRGRVGVLVRTYVRIGAVKGDHMHREIKMARLKTVSIVTDNDRYYY